jgi:GH24 family phage-related lysozyme (muramidase)
MKIIDHKIACVYAFLLCLFLLTNPAQLFAQDKTEQEFAKAEDLRAKAGRGCGFNSSGDFICEGEDLRGALNLGTPPSGGYVGMDSQNTTRPSVPAYNPKSVAYQPYVPEYPDFDWLPKPTLVQPRWICSLNKNPTTLSFYGDARANISVAGCGAKIFGCDAGNPESYGPHTIDYAISILHQREGFRENAYRVTRQDGTTESLWTVGYGTLIDTPEELDAFRRYHPGAFPKDLLEAWFRRDLQTYINKAVSQAKDLGQANNSCLISLLISANYQLGDFKYKFGDTYALMKAGNYCAAANLLPGYAWYRQTCNRVLDFMQALKHTGNCS